MQHIIPLLLVVASTSHANASSLAKDVLTAKTQCPGNSDGDYFRCITEGTCISEADVCNGKQDCRDNSDEALCECRTNEDCLRKGLKFCEKNIAKAITSCSRCLAGYKYTGDQCEDVNECESQNPSICPGNSVCLNYGGGYSCTECPKGYEPKLISERHVIITKALKDWKLKEAFQCDDRNECEIDNPCKNRGHCVNLVGRFACECPQQHEPHGDHCRAVGVNSPKIALADNTTMSIYDLREKTLLESVKVAQPIVDMAAYKDAIFYAFKHQIWEYSLDTSRHSLLVDLIDNDSILGDRLESIRKISVDWEHKRLYFLTSSSVNVADFFGQGGTILHHGGAITGMSVDPVARYMFYTEGFHVKRVHLDASKASEKSIFRALATGVSDNLPSGQTVAVDPNTRTVYYINDRILYSFDYDGGFILVLSTAAPYSHIEPFEDRIYAVYRASGSRPVSLPRIGYTIGGKKSQATTVDFLNNNRISALTVVHIAKFPEASWNVSSCYKGACASGWCFPLPAPQSEGHRCVCSLGDHEACAKISLKNYHTIENTISAEMSSSSATILSASAFRALLSFAVFILFAQF